MIGTTLRGDIKWQLFKGWFFWNVWRVASDGVRRKVKLQSLPVGHIFDLHCHTYIREEVRKRRGDMSSSSDPVNIPSRVTPKTSISQSSESTSSSLLAVVNRTPCNLPVVVTAGTSNTSVSVVTTTPAAGASTSSSSSAPHSAMKNSGLYSPTSIVY